MPYNDLKLTNTDSLSSTATKFNNLLNNIASDLSNKLDKDSYIVADELKLVDLYNSETQALSPLLEDYTSNVLFRFCDPIKLQELLADRTTNEDKIQQIAYVFLLLMHSVGLVDITSDQISDYYTYVEEHFTADAIACTTPFLQKRILNSKEDEVTVANTFYLNNITQAVIVRTHKISTKEELNSITYKIPVNSTIKNEMYDILSTFANNNLIDPYKSDFLGDLEFVFTQYIETSSSSTKGSLITSATYNANDTLSKGISCFGRLLKDVVEITLDYTTKDTSTKATIHTAVTSGTPITFDTLASIKINNDSKQSIQSLYGLSNYILLLVIKASDGDLIYLLPVIDGYQIAYYERIDNYSPYIFGLNIVFIPQVNTWSSLLVTSSFSGVFDLGIFGGTTPSIYFNPGTGIYADTYTSNSVFMCETTADIDKRLAYGINNVVYPSTDIISSIADSNVIEILSYNKDKKLLGVMTEDSLKSRIVPPFTKDVITKPDATVDDLVTITGFTKDGASISLPKEDVINGADLSNYVTKAELNIGLSTKASSDHTHSEYMLNTAKINLASQVTGTLSTANIADDAVTGAKIAANTITASNIANDTITATQIAPNAITASELANSSVTDAKLSGFISNAHGGLGGAISASDGRKLSYISTTASNTPENAATYTGRYRTTQWVNYPSGSSNGAQGELYNYNWNEGNAATAKGWGYQEYTTPIGEKWYRVRNNSTFTANTGWQKVRASNGAATLVDVNAIITAIKSNPAGVRTALGLGTLATLSSINLSDTTKTTGILPSSRGGFDYQNYLG